MLKWKKQDKPEFKREFARTAGEYGWWRVTRLFLGVTFLEPSPRTHECYGERLAIRPDLRGRGIGTRLMEYGKKYAARRGFKELTLYVTADNRAVDLYKRLGFRIIRSQESFTTERLLGSRGWYHMSCNLESG
jgi:ribosomal protein S18 acetylase RimI-like enzyme